MRLFAIASAVVLLAAACSSGDDGRSLESYVAELEPVMRAYHDELGAQRATWLDMDDERLAAAYGAYQQSLDEFAAALAEIVPADDATAGHEAMTVATRAIADIYGDRAQALAGTGEAADFDGREEERSAEWVTACHDVQDPVLVEEIDVDLLCVTMLGSNAEATE